MRSWPIALAFLASSTAVAGFNPFGYDRAQLFDFADSVSIDGVVEVPLYRAVPGSSQDCVEVTLPDGSVHLFELVIGQAGVSVSEDFAKAAGAKVKEVKFKDGAGKSKVTTLDSFSIGAVAFSNVASSVGFSRTKGIPRAGSIGIAGFPQLAGALVHSEGVLRLAPAAEGENLLVGLGGNQMAYTQQELSIFEFSKKKKVVTPPLTMVMSGTFGDKETTMAFGIQSGSSASIALVEGLDVLPMGSRQYASDAVSVAGVGGELLAEIQSGLRLYPSGVDFYLGEDAVVDWDIAWSPSNMALSIRQAEKSGVTLYSEQAIAQLAESLEEKEGEEEAKPKDAEAAEAAEEAAKKAKAGTYSKMAGLAMLASGADKSMGYADDALAGDPENCAMHLMHGKVAMRAGKLDVALKDFQSAADLYAPWAALDRETREDLAKEAQEDQPKQQASACFEASSLHALVVATDGDAKALEGLDIGNESLTPLSAAAVGNAYLASGDAAAAIPAFLQVSRLERSNAWAGLGIAQSAKGQHDKALANLAQGMWADPSDLELARHFVGTLTQVHGAEKAANHMGAFAGKMPTNGTWQLASAEAQIAAGQDGTAALSAAEERFQWAMTFAPTTEMMGQFAHAKIARGDYATACAIANKALGNAGGAVSALTAKAACEVNDGNLDAAKDLLKLAAASGNPAHAARLAEELVAPIVEEDPVEGEEGTTEE
jgi:hypothetical protein